MAIGLGTVQAVVQATGSAGTNSINFNATVANNLVVFLVSGAGGTAAISSITDNKGNSYTVNSLLTSAGNNAMAAIAAGIQTTAGATKGSVVLASTTPNIRLAMFEIAGIATANYTDGAGSLASSGTDVHFTSFNTTNSNDIVIAGGDIIGPGTVVGGYTLGGTAAAIYSQYQIFSGTAAATGTLHQPNQNYTWVGAAYKASTGLVQSSGTAVLGLGSTSVVWPSKTTAGNLVVVGVNLTNAAALGTVSSVTDNQSNTYTRAIRGTISSLGDILNTEIWYASNITAVPAITIAGSIGTIADAATVTGTYTFSTNSNRVLVVGAGAHQQNVGTVLLNGTSITKVVQGTSASNEQVNLWFYNNPPSGAAGTIVAKADGGAGVGFVAAEFYNVSQASQPSGSAHSDQGNSSQPAGTSTSLTNNNMFVGGFYSEGGYLNEAANPGQVAIMHQTAQSFENIALSYLPQTVSGAGTMIWNIASSQRWASAMLSLEPVFGSVTVSHTVDNCAMFAREYSGFDTLDQTNGANGSSAAPNTGTLTTLFGTELIIVSTGDDKGVTQTYTAAGGYGNMIGTATTLTGQSMEDNLAISAGAQTGTLTLGATANWEGLMATFYKAAPAVSANSAFRALLGVGN